MSTQVTDAEAGSSTANNGTKQPIAQGQESAKKSPEQLLTEYKLENERKQGEVSSLRGELDEMKGLYAELVEQGRMKEAKHVKEDISDLKDEINSLRSKPENKAFFKHLDDSLEGTLKSAEERGANRALAVLQKSLLRKTAKAEGVKVEELVKELKSFAGKHSDEDILTKTELAIEDWKEFQEFKKEKAELEKEKAKLNSSSENGNRQSRASTLDDAKAANDIQGMKKHLGL
jgi:hypothetical protein